MSRIRKFENGFRLKVNEIYPLTTSPKVKVVFDNRDEHILFDFSLMKFFYIFPVLISFESTSHKHCIYGRFASPKSFIKYHRMFRCPFLQNIFTE